MIAESIYFTGHHCFKTGWSGFDTVCPINVIIGRNNTGKSHLLDLVEAICVDKQIGKGRRCKYSGTLDEQTLKAVFQPNLSGGTIGGRHWEEHGAYFQGQRVVWETDLSGNPREVTFSPEFNPAYACGARAAEERLDYLRKGLKRVTHRLSNSHFLRLLADRDIRPERSIKELTLSREGGGATNIIRRHISTTSSQYPRELIQVELLDALNQVFARDGKFTEITVKELDEVTAPPHDWEVYLGQDKKGLVALSSSGSGLKTVILVLLNLLVMPKILGKSPSGFTFAFEELENNLHPALLRRLLGFLEEYAIREKCYIFLTTHSSTALDLFGGSKNAQIIHVSHDGESAHTTRVAAHLDQLGVISELGAKPSDLLQANGIIWVEGPSDRVYLDRWLEILTNGRLREGRDYQCAFYGGALLARTQFRSSEEAEKELINLFRINSNIVVVCDGDRSTNRSPLKDRVKRIRSEVEKIPRAHIWITRAREIENYLPGSLVARGLGLHDVPDPGEHELFFPRKGKSNVGSSFVESKLKRKGIDKMELAALTVETMSKADMLGRFDWEKEMEKIVACIDSWNR